MSADQIVPDTQHRVVAAHGLGGFAGQTAGAQISIKTWLLTHEGVQ